jgi:RNA polymerase sigma factor (TIGR02999 family)
MDNDARALNALDYHEQSGMSDASNSPADELLRRWRDGDQSALHHLLPVVYQELRRVARRHLRGERADHTLQTTALVHEAYLRLVGQGPKEVHSRCHFIGLTSHLMRQILVDHARERLAEKRQGGLRVTLAEEPFAAQTPEVDVLAINDALTRLATFDAQQAQIVELRYFGGLTIRETSEFLGISPATVKRDWVTARAWLHREMQQRAAP